MPTRREARERALGLAYEAEIRGVDLPRSSPSSRCSPTTTRATSSKGVAEHADEIDALLRKYSEHWALERMPVVDRTLLRLSTFELGWVPEVPPAAVITEAVELAKQYSTKDSGRFVNGLARAHRRAVARRRLTHAERDASAAPERIEEPSTSRSSFPTSRGSRSSGTIP